MLDIVDVDASDPRDWSVDQVADGRAHFKAVRPGAAVVGRVWTKLYSRRLGLGKLPEYAPSACLSAAEAALAEELNQTFRDVLVARQIARIEADEAAQKARQVAGRPSRAATCVDCGNPFTAYYWPSRHQWPTRCDYCKCRVNRKKDTTDEVPTR